LELKRFSSVQGKWGKTICPRRERRRLKRKLKKRKLKKAKQHAANKILHQSTNNYPLPIFSVHSVLPLLIMLREAKFGLVFSALSRHETGFCGCLKFAGMPLFGFKFCLLLPFEASSCNGHVLGKHNVLLSLVPF